MIALEALQSVQFVSVEDRRLAVLDAEDWEALVEWLETMEDIQTAKEAFTQFWGLPVGIESKQVGSNGMT